MARVKLNRRNIQKLGKSEPVTRGLARGAAAGARGAASRAPRDTGALADSYVSETEPGSAWFGSIRDAPGHPDHPVDYAVFVELGTRYMEAQPHLRPAIDDAIKAIEATRP
jgi:hypothetical protein